MQALIRKSDGDVQFVSSTNGYDLSLFDVLPVPDGVNPREVMVSAGALVPRPPSAAEVVQESLKGDQMWTRLLTSTPAQIETYLGNNMTNIAQARAFVRFLLLAIRALADRRSL